MSIRKRLKAFWAALTQTANTFRCQCGKTALVIGDHAPDFTGMLCADCEADESERWLNDFYTRHPLLDVDTRGAA